VIEMVAPQCFDSINTLRLEVINKIEQLRRHLTTLLDDENAPEPATSADL
jgi:hypothetical protein